MVLHMRRVTVSSRVPPHSVFLEKKSRGRKGRRKRERGRRIPVGLETVII